MGNRRTAAHNYQPPSGTTSDYALALALLAPSFTSYGGTDTMGVPPHTTSGRMAWSDTHSHPPSLETAMTPHAVNGRRDYYYAGMGTE